MKAYNEDFKNTLIKKALLQPDISLRRLAKEASISCSTLHNWIQKHKGTNSGEEDTPRNHSNDWTKEERFNMLMESSILTEEQQGAYCRRKGIFRHQLLEWKKEFMNPKAEIKSTKNQVELKKLRVENKILKKELRRKEKALAEASALLVLKKKAHLLWGDLEED